MTDPAAPLAIIRWTKEELPEGIHLLLAEAVAEGYAWMSRFLPEWTQRPFLEAGEGLFLAMEDTTPIAMAVLSFDHLAGEADTGRLRFIFVSNAARRRGLAERLVQACLARAGHRWARITLHTDNAIAARLYQRYGFSPASDNPRNTHHLIIAGNTSGAPEGAAP